MGIRHLDLFVDERVLIPRPETEEVVGVAIEFARAVEGGRTVIDLGTGSGAIGLALATELPIDNTSIWMTDISPVLSQLPERTSQELVDQRECHDH